MCLCMYVCMHVCYYIYVAKFSTSFATRDNGLAQLFATYSTSSGVACEVVNRSHCSKTGAVYAGTITCHAGTITCHAGTITCHAGTITCHAGTITCHAGTITCHAGTITCHAGTITHKIQAVSPIGASQGSESKLPISSHKRVGTVNSANRSV
jgi:hypothetical protein